MNWKNVEKKYQEMLKHNHQVILKLKEKGVEKEYFIWSCEEGEIWMLPIDESIEGPLFEMIPHNAYAIRLAQDFDEDATEKIVAAIFDENQQVQAMFAESCDPEEENEGEIIYFVKMHLLSNPLPQGFTGKYFRLDMFGDFEYVN